MNPLTRRHRTKVIEEAIDRLRSLAPSMRSHQVNEMTKQSIVCDCTGHVIAQANFGEYRRVNMLDNHIDAPAHSWSTATFLDTLTEDEVLTIWVPVTDVFGPTAVPKTIDAGTFR